VLSQLTESLSTSLKSDVAEREMERESWTGASLFAELKHRNQEKPFACSLARVRESSTHLPAWSGAPATPYGRDSHHTMMRWLQSCSLLWILVVVDNIHVWTLCIKIFYIVDVTANLLYMSRWCPWMTWLPFRPLLGATIKHALRPLPFRVIHTFSSHLVECGLHYAF